MSMSMKVAVRHRNGSINHYNVTGVEDWRDARDYVLSQVPTARTVMALIIGGDRRLKPNETPSAA